MEIVIVEGFGVFRCDTTSDKRKEFLRALKQIMENYQAFFVQDIYSGKDGGGEIYVSVNESIGRETVIAVLKNVILYVAQLVELNVYFDVLLPNQDPRLVIDSDCNPVWPERSLVRFLGRA